MKGIPQPIVTLFGIVVTLFGILVSAAIGIAALNASRDALARNQRAWLAPRGFKISEDYKPYSKGTATEITLVYGNVGREPAIKVNQEISAGTISRYDYVKPKVFEAALHSILNRDSCDSLPLDNPGLAVYPGSTDAYGIRYKIAGSLIDDDVMKGEKFVLVVACFAYETSQKPHHSSFCGFLDPTSGGPPSSWTFAICPAGNSAD
jgi:hypothetical protein